jgi:hypothetical protein
VGLIGVCHIEVVGLIGVCHIEVLGLNKVHTSAVYGYRRSGFNTQVYRDKGLIHNCKRV